MTTKIAPHFTWREVTRSATATRLDIANNPPSSLRVNIGRMVETMEYVRALLGGEPIRVTSWYRCLALNEAIGGSPTSRHMLGLACDFKPPRGMSLETAFRNLAESDILFDQLIAERTRRGAAWIHLGLSVQEPRREVLTAEGDTLGGPMAFRRVRARAA